MNNMLTLKRINIHQLLLDESVPKVESYDKI